MDRSNLKRNGELVRDLMSMLNDAKRIDYIPSMIEVIIGDECWKHRMILTSGEIVEFDSFEKFVTTPPLEGLGMDYNRLYQYCKGTPAQQMIEEVSKPVQGNGGDRKSDDYKNQLDISNRLDADTKGGTSRNYTIKRLKRDRPDLAERVISGEISANQAAIEAGFRPPKTTIRLDDMQAVAETLASKLTNEQIQELINYLTR